ncbi:MAG: glycoside hydrolase domain-containing protein [Planctomycetota bacterium]
MTEPFGTRPARATAVVVTALLAPLAAPRSAAAAPEPATLELVSPLVKVRSLDDARRGARPPRLAAARGEAESLQVVVTSQGAPARAVVSLGALRRAGGTETIPASAVRIDRVGRVLVRRASVSDSLADKLRGAAELLKLDLPAPRLAAPEAWPDPLLPGGPLELEPGGFAVAWLTITIPRDAVAGTYQGELRCEVRAGGATTTLRRSLELRVWDVALPLRPTLRTSFGMSEGELARRLPDTSPERRRALFAEHRGALRAARVSPRFTARPQVQVDAATGAVRIDWSAFDRALEAEVALGLTGFDMDWFQLPGGWSFGSDDLKDLPERGLAGVRERYQKVRDRLRDPAATRVSRELLRQTEEHLAAKGWLELGYIYLVDEPLVLALPLLREEYALIKRAAPRLRVLQTVNASSAPGQPFLRGLVPAGYRLLEGVVDIWVVTAAIFDAPVHRRRQRAGEEVWVYTCISSGRPIHNCWQIDAPGVYDQIGFWTAFRQGLDGYLYWNTMDWSRADPWTDPMTYPGGNGDGSLFYPSAEGVVRSLRLDLIRDGIEVFDLLTLLEREVARLLGEGDLRRALEAGALLDLSRLAPTFRRYTLDPAALEARRLAVGEALDSLARARRGG